MNKIELPQNQIAMEQEDELRELLPAITFDRIAVPEQLEDVSKWRTAADKGLKKVAELFDPQVKSAHEAHKKAVALRDQFKAPYEQVKKICMGMMNDWEARQQAIREEAERKRQEEIRKAVREAEEKAARERAAAEKALAEAKAAKDRIAAETAKQNLEAARQAEQNVLAGNVAIEMPPEEYIPPAPEIKGYSATRKWKADEATIDKTALIVAAAKQPALQVYLDVNVKLVNSMMSKTEGKALIPGVQAMSYMQTTQRG